MKLMVSSLTFLTHYDNKKNGFLKSLITGIDTWILYDNPETKKQSKQWMAQCTPATPASSKNLNRV